MYYHLKILSKLSFILLSALNYKNILVYSKFNLNYLTSNQHKMKMLPTPIKQDTIPLDSLLISNRNGRMFACTIPQIDTSNEEEENENKIKDQDTKIEKIKTVIPKSEIIDYIDKLAANKGTKHLSEESKNSKSALNNFPRPDCYYHSTSDWWSYEICINSHISQFHLENGKPTQISLIGTFTKNFNWDSRPDVKIDAIHYHDFNKFAVDKQHVQYYEQGMVCDITNKPRTAKLLFKCIDTSIKSTKLISIVEKSTCNYEITLHSYLICSHPDFANKKEDSKLNVNTNQYNIECYRILSDEEYIAYENKIHLQNLENEIKLKLKNDNLMSDFIKTAKDNLLSSNNKDILEKNQVLSIKSLAQDFGNTLTSKGLESLQNIIKNAFTKATAEGNTIRSLRIDGEKGIVEIGKKRAENENEDEDEDEEEEDEDDLNENSDPDTPHTRSAKKNSNLVKKDIEDQVDDLGQQELDSKTGQDKLKTSFVDKTGNNLKILEDSEIPEQLKNLQKSLAEELKAAGHIDENEPNEIQIKIINVGPEDVEQIDNVGHMDLPKLTPEQLKQIKNALLMSMVKESPEKGLIAESEYDELNSGYNEESEEIGVENTKTAQINAEEARNGKYNSNNVLNSGLFARFSSRHENTDRKKNEKKIEL